MKVMVLLLFIFSLCVEIKGEKICGENEVQTDCGSACVETCETLTGILPQPTCTEECIPNTCKCVPGFIWKTDQDRTCVAEQYCYEHFNFEPILVDPIIDPPSDEPRCPVNERWSECEANCQATCSTYLGLEPPKICPMICRRPGSCICQAGFVRMSDKNSTCVPEVECSLIENCVPKICADHETWTNCGKLCESNCAIYLGLEYPKPCIDMCVENTCECEPGYIRVSETDSTCVAVETCSSYYPKTSHCCEKHEIWYNCANPCPPTCANVLGLEPTVYCRALCRPNCECKPGFVRISKTDSTCVPEKTCSHHYPSTTKVCRKHETWAECATPCPKTCANTLGLEPLKLCKAKCIPNCVCKSGFVQISDNDSSCVAEETCSHYNPKVDPPKQECGKHEIWAECPSKCPTTCAIALGHIAIRCIDGCNSNPCVCEEGYVRVSFEDNTCIRLSDCAAESFP